MVNSADFLEKVLSLSVMLGLDVDMVLSLYFKSPVQKSNKRDDKRGTCPRTSLTTLDKSYMLAENKGSLTLHGITYEFFILRQKLLFFILFL